MNAARMWAQFLDLFVKRESTLPRWVSGIDIPSSSNTAGASLPGRRRPK
jgi:hypothetical protein